MKKSSKLLLTLSLIGFGVTALASCDTSSISPFIGKDVAFEGGNVDVPTSYEITNASADYAYLDGLPAKGEAGKTYSFRVSLKPGYHFNDKVTITAGENTVGVTKDGSTFSFVMPSSDITVSVDTGTTDFTITNKSYFVKDVYLDDGKETLTTVKSAVPGTLLKFEAIADMDFSFTEITLNGKPITASSDGFYHFAMPVRPVVINSDKNAIAYNVSIATELTLSTAKIYKNAETKETIANAIKGDTVYVEFSSEIEYMNYTVTAKNSSGDSLTVTPVGESGNAFSFEMVSSNVEISVVEKDMTLYHSASIIEKAWKGQEIYSSSKALKTYAYADLSAAQSFSTDGTMKTKDLSATWNPVDASHADCTYTSYNSSYGTSTVVPFKAAWTNHILALQWISSSSTATSAKWSDAYFCLADDTYVLHALSFDYYRLAWIEDASGNILETVLVENGNIHLNVTIKKSDGTAAIGSDITLTSDFSIYEGETKLMGVSSAAPAIESAISVSLAEYTTCKVLDASGNDITVGTSGKTITLQPRLADDAPSSYSLNAPVVKDANGSTVTVTSVANGDYTDYTFTMPTTAVTVTTSTKDTERYANYPALGDYTAYNLCNSYKEDVDFSNTSYAKTTISVTKDGTFKLGSTSYEVNAMDNANNGKITVAKDEVESTVYFGDNLIVHSYYLSRASQNDAFADVYIGVKVPEGHTISEITNQVHWMSSSWAVTYYCGDEVLGSIFAYDVDKYEYGANEIYTGVTFTFDEGSTRIGSSSSYHVVKDGVTLFDVVNGKATKKSSAE